ncbi:MAG TPA: alpha/beta hydrolase [Saprospiraceae bacterium]|nr:alpha/beta hydrolase [Saprospiraceae bacterium]
MKLIFVHGRAQEKFDADTLKAEWTEAWRKGLNKSGLKLPADVSIEFPYYGKLLDELVREAQAQPKQAEGKRGGESYSMGEEAEVEFYTTFLGEIAAQSTEGRAEQREVEEILEAHRGTPLNWEPVQKLLSFLDRKKIFGEAILKNFTRDVFMYLTRRHIKERVNEVVLQSFDNGPCVVVGHSLGSIVSYLVLKNHPEFRVQKFITLGSPLGLRSVRQFIEPPVQIPDCINGKDWLNAYDERDLVALNPLNREHFNTNPPIENKKNVKNHTDNHHGIKGYLDDEVVAKVIYEACADKS